MGKMPWRREWLPTPVFFPGEFHGQRSVASYSSKGHKDSDTTERLNWTELCLLAKLLQSCPTLCNPMDYSPPGFSVHGILQTRILEWVAILSSRESSQPRDWTYVSWIGRQILYLQTTREAQRTLISATMLTKMNAAFKKKQKQKLSTDITKWTQPQICHLSPVWYLRQPPNFFEPHFPSCKVRKIPPSSPGGKD